MRRRQCLPCPPHRRKHLMKECSGASHDGFSALPNRLRRSKRSQLRVQARLLPHGHRHPPRRDAVTSRAPDVPSVHPMPQRSGQRLSPALRRAGQPRRRSANQPVRAHHRTSVPKEAADCADGADGAGLPHGQARQRTPVRGRNRQPRSMQRQNPCAALLPRARKAPRPPDSRRIPMPLRRTSPRLPECTLLTPTARPHLSPCHRHTLNHRHWSRSRPMRHPDPADPDPRPTTDPHPVRVLRGPGQRRSRADQRRAAPFGA